MESPKTYKGYDKEGKCITTKTAVDATTMLDPAEVKSAIENIKSVMTEQMGKISSALTSLSSDANEAVIVQGTSMSGAIEDTANVLGQIPGTVMGEIEPLYDLAVTTHDKLQREENEKAESAVRSTSGVVSVSSS